MNLHELYLQFSAAMRLKNDGVARAAKMLKEHMRGSEGGVSTKIHLHRRRHPPNIVKTPAVDDERGLGHVVFRRDLLEELIGQPFVEDANTGGIAGERTAREGEHFVIRDGHHESVAAFSFFVMLSEVEASLNISVQ